MKPSKSVALPLVLLLISAGVVQSPHALAGIETDSQQPTCTAAAATSGNPLQASAAAVANTAAAAAALQNTNHPDASLTAQASPPSGPTCSADIQQYQALGERVLAELSPEARQQFLAEVESLARLIAQRPQCQSAPAASTSTATSGGGGAASTTNPDGAYVINMPPEDGVAIQMPAELSDSSQASPASYVSRWKQKWAPICAGVVAGASALCSCITENEWIKAGSLSISAAVLYASSGIAANLVSLPNEWSGFSKIVAKSALGAGLTLFPNLLNYKAIEIGMTPGTAVNLIALGSLMNLVGGITGTCGSIIFFNQQVNWTVWVGLLSTAVVSAIQIQYALDHPSTSK